LSKPHSSLQHTSFPGIINGRSYIDILGAYFLTGSTLGALKYVLYILEAVISLHDFGARLELFRRG
jgi:hypothetical protein